MPKTQIVYYGDSNEFFARLNIIVFSYNAGNTDVNNEIIYILKLLRERKIIV